MTTPLAPPVACHWETGNGDQRPLCGEPAVTYIWADNGDAVLAVCDQHRTQALAEGGWSTEGPELPSPELHGDNLDGHAAARQAIESALAAAPKGGAARTIEAKAEHIHQQLVAKGWHLAKPDPGHGLVQVGPDEQIVTVPDGHVVEVVPTTPTISYADNELDTLAGIVTQLEGLDPDARERVAGFVTHRYGPTSPAVSPWAALSGWDPSRLDRARAQGTYSTDLPGADGG